MEERFEKSRMRISILLDSCKLCLEPEKEYVSIVSSSQDANTCWIDELETLLYHPTHPFIDWKTSDCLTWVHVPATNCVLKAKNDAILLFMLRSNFRSSGSPDDSLLTCTDHRYFSTRRGDTRKDITVVVHEAARSEYEAFRDTLTTRTSGAYPNECPVHLERTLDEAYYPELSAYDLRARNDDQVVTSKFKSEPGVPRGISTILIVPKLWIWRYDNIMISAHRFHIGRRCSWKKGLDRNGEQISVLQPKLNTGEKDPLLSMGRLLAECIKAFGREEILKYKGETLKCPPALDLFESRVVFGLAEVESYMQSTNRSRIDFDKEAEFHYSISDIRSELAMIKHFLVQQQQIFGSLLEENNLTRVSKKYGLPEVDDAWNTGDPPNWDSIQEAEVMLVPYLERVEKIDGDAERIGASVQDMLNLKRTYASVQDSHASVLLSTAAIGFAIVTIIFTPLAFLTALFALDMQGFDRLRVSTLTSSTPSASDNQNVNMITPSEDTVYHGGKMSGIFIGTEILTIGLTVLAVWLSLRYFGIDIRDMRMAHLQNKKDTKKAQQGSQGKEGKTEKRSEKQETTEKRKEEEMKAKKEGINNTATLGAATAGRRSKLSDVEEQKDAQA
ncbi:hypothetical protein CC86DRAFT_456174 [Ophiobolus disseminans]|uniref:Uncharacterized protein n=1 Tax=Ophiobolus disseminans TaxID=1469910 RepID=A0A6A6ZXK9_9PLEO|nr:hypothetical protein CC86DRAFT_456174 [Ophiobolus disseminans]